MKTGKSKNQRPFFKWSRRVLLALIVALPFTWWFLNASPPESVQGAPAKTLAQKVHERLGMPAFKQLQYVSWSHRGRHHYVWSPAQNKVRIDWNDYTVELDLETQFVQAYSHDNVIGDPRLRKSVLHVGWEFWQNDRFWLVPFYEIDHLNVSWGLMVEDHDTLLHMAVRDYNVAPGTDYLWHLDGNDLPEGVEMWSEKLPFGGMYFEWSDYDTLGSAALSASVHQHKIMDIPITDIKAAATWQELGWEENPFRGKLSEF